MLLWIAAACRSFALMETVSGFLHGEERSEFVWDCMLSYRISYACFLKSLDKKL